MHIAQPSKRFYDWVRSAKRKEGKVRDCLFFACLLLFIYHSSIITHHIIQYTFKKRGRPSNRSVRDIVEVRSPLLLVSLTQSTCCLQTQDLIKDFADKKGRLATVRAVKHHCQYLAQLKAINEGRGISLVSDTGRGVGCESRCDTHSYSYSRHAYNTHSCLSHFDGPTTHSPTHTHRNGGHNELCTCWVRPNRQP